MVTVSGCEVHIGTGPNCRANELRAGGKARLDLGGQASNNHQPNTIPGRAPQGAYDCFQVSPRPSVTKVAA
jgi:hypothetical protein